MAQPQVTATPDKDTYAKGEPVVVTFTVAGDEYDKPTQRTVTFTGHDDEGNAVEGTIVTTVLVPTSDTFTLDSVTWADSGEEFTVDGLTARGTA